MVVDPPELKSKQLCDGAQSARLRRAVTTHQELCEDYLTVLTLTISVTGVDHNCVQQSHTSVPVTRSHPITHHHFSTGRSNLATRP